MATSKLFRPAIIILGFYILIIGAYHMGVPFEDIYPGKECVGATLSAEGAKLICESPWGERRPTIGVVVALFGGLLIWAGFRRTTNQHSSQSKM